MTAAADVRLRLLKAAVLEKIDLFAAPLSDPHLAGVRVTVKLRADGVPRAVTVEPELRVEARP